MYARFARTKDDKVKVRGFHKNEKVKLSGYGAPFRLYGDKIGKCKAQQRQLTETPQLLCTFLVSWQVAGFFVGKIGFFLPGKNAHVALRTKMTSFLRGTPKAHIVFLIAIN